MNPPPTKPAWLGEMVEQVRQDARTDHQRIRKDLEDYHQEMMQELKSQRVDLIDARERVRVLEALQKTQTDQRAAHVIGRRAWLVVFVTSTVSIGWNVIRWITTGHP